MTNALTGPNGYQYQPYTPPAPGYIWVNGQQVKYTPPTSNGSVDENGKTSWTSTPAAGMTETAKNVNKVTSNQLGADDFMKLLVAQLRYQDPTKPSDTAQMMQQTAAMSMVERVNEMATSAETMSKAVQELAQSNGANQAAYGALLMEQRMSSAVNLVGKTITYADAKDPKVTADGVVESVKFDTSGPILVVGGKDVPLASVSAVKPATSTASTAATGTGSTPTTPTTPSSDTATPPAASSAGA